MFGYKSDNTCGYLKELCDSDMLEIGLYLI